jgi:bifunctional UDP-N-acetylglucosamine pyrophosphorylase/glucosamine-1-phosphate N-acetyltransferase
MELSVVILAAGQSTRLRSSLPKVLHPIAGRPMIHYSVEAARQLGVSRPVVIVGHAADQVRRLLGDDVEYVYQAERLGTGHAVLQARALLEPRAGSVLVYYGDMPLLRAETLRALLDLHAQSRARSPLTMLTVHSADSMGFGRVVRDADGRVQAVVEEAVASPGQKRITELNCGVYCFEAGWLWPHLAQIPLSPKGEYYLTDLVGLAAGEGYPIAAYTIDDVEEVLGVNDRVQLAAASRIMRRRINERLMRAGVTLVDPETAYIEAGVQIGQDSVVHPNTHILGCTRIGAECEIGPNSIIRDATIGDRCQVLASVVESAVLEDDVDVGPFGHLRKGAHLAAGVHMGNFGEVKNSYLGAGTKMGHFSYIGDAEVGRGVNIGAGTVTCNFDGERKHKTVIEDGAFIGSDTMLRAPVRVGAGAKTGAGAVVTHDVPAGCVALGVPARIHKRPADQEPPAEEQSAQR